MTDRPGPHINGLSCGLSAATLEALGLAPHSPAAAGEVALDPIITAATTVWFDQPMNWALSDQLRFDYLSTFERSSSVDALVNGIDHLVISHPDAEELTVQAGQAGLEITRVREVADGVTQHFHRAGSVILEFVCGMSIQPAFLWGITWTCADLDRSVATLGPLCGEARPAIQPGRRIATMRTKSLQPLIRMALMDDPGRA